MDRRVIKSESELVNALCKGVGVCVTVDNGYYPFELSMKTALSSYEQGVKFNYSEPVEVVELYKNPYLEGFYLAKEKSSYSIHKQTEILIDNRIIWTETEEIINK